MPPDRAMLPTSCNTNQRGREAEMRRFVLVVIALASLGCAATQQMVKPPKVTTETYDAPFERTWSAMVETITASGMPIRIVEKGSGLIATEPANFVNGPYSKDTLRTVADFECRLCLLKAGRRSINAYSESVTESTSRVRLAVRIEAWDGMYDRGWWPVESNGTIERQIFDGIRNKLRR